MAFCSTVPVQAEAQDSSAPAIRTIRVSSEATYDHRATVDNIRQPPWNLLFLGDGAGRLGRARLVRGAPEIASATLPHFQTIGAEQPVPERESSARQEPSLNFEHETFDVEAARTFVGPPFMVRLVGLNSLDPHHAIALRAWRVFQRVDGAGLFHPDPRTGGN